MKAESLKPVVKVPPSMRRSTLQAVLRKALKRDPAVPSVAGEPASERHMAHARVGLGATRPLREGPTEATRRPASRGALRPPLNWHASKTWRSPALPLVRKMPIHVEPRSLEEIRGIVQGDHLERPLLHYVGGTCLVESLTLQKAGEPSRAECIIQQDDEH